MRQTILILTTAIFLLSCNQNDTKQKELELKEREPVLKEKEFALKEKDSANSIAKKETVQVSKPLPVQVSKPLPDETKTLTLISPTFHEGDGGNGFLEFQNYATNQAGVNLPEHEYDSHLPAIEEIRNKCNANEECPALKNQVYSATFKLKLMPIYENSPELGYHPTGKKAKGWFLFALSKVATP